MRTKLFSKVVLLATVFAVPAFADDENKSFNEKWKERVIGGSLYFDPQYRRTVDGELGAGTEVRTDLDLTHLKFLSNKGTDFSGSFGTSPDEGVTSFDLKLKGYADHERIRGHFGIPLELGVNKIDSIVDESQVQYDEGTKRLTASRKLGLEGRAFLGKIPKYSPSFYPFDMAGLPQEEFHVEEDYKDTLEIPYEVAVKALLGASNGEGVLALTAEAGTRLPRVACINGKEMSDRRTPKHSLCGTIDLKVGVGPALSTDGLGVAIYGDQSLGLSYQNKMVLDHTDRGRNVLVFEVAPNFFMHQVIDPTIKTIDSGFMVNAGVSWGIERKPTALPGVEYDAEGTPVER